MAQDPRPLSFVVAGQMKVALRRSKRALIGPSQSSIGRLKRAGWRSTKRSLAELEVVYSWAVGVSVTAGCEGAEGVRRPPRRARVEAGESGPPTGWRGSGYSTTVLLTQTTESSGATLPSTTAQARMEPGVRGTLTSMVSGGRAPELTMALLHSTSTCGFP